MTAVFGKMQLDKQGGLAHFYAVFLRF